ncbi:hypothetical protein Tco_1316844 [Tanacetum coccineum]
MSLTHLKGLPAEALKLGQDHTQTWGRKPAKAEPSVHKDLAFDELADDTLDYMETENAQDVRKILYKENKQVGPHEPEVHVKMEMEIPRSSRVKFITACSYSIDKYKDMMKAQVHVIQVFRYSDTQKIFLEVIMYSR